MAIKGITLWGGSRRRWGRLRVRELVSCSSSTQGSLKEKREKRGVIDREGKISREGEIGQ